MNKFEDVLSLIGLNIGDIVLIKSKKNSDKLVIHITELGVFDVETGKERHDIFFKLLTGEYEIIGGVNKK